MPRGNKKTKKAKTPRVNVVGRLDQDLQSAVAKKSISQVEIDEYKERLLALDSVTEGRKIAARQRIYDNLVALKEKRIGLSVKFDDSERAILASFGVTVAPPKTSETSIFKVPQKVFYELQESSAVIELALQTLSRYKVGVPQEKLNTICQDLKSSIDALEPKKHMIQSQKTFNLKQCENINKRLDMLTFEGKGGLKDDKGLYALYCKIAAPLVVLIRAVLNVITLIATYLFGGKNHKKSLDESSIKRPFFFQSPISKSEKKLIDTKLTELKALSTKVKDALDNATEEKGVTPNF
ncbi:MAG: hypothetical protein K0U37_09235 [Gammaproteobacteria bacterium]|nr:hypothetical protein [Gammaproteobacteria bacterium]